MRQFRHYMLPTLLLGVLLSCQKEDNPMPAFGQITPGQALVGELIVIKGTGLSSLQKITFGTVDAPFNPVYNTDAVVMVRVPETAAWGPQKITLTNAAGKVLELPALFNVLQPAPVIESIDPILGGAGTVVTITGHAFDNLTAVTFGTLPAEVLSKSKTEIKAKVPAGLTESTIIVATAGGTDTFITQFSPNNTFILADFDGNGLRDDTKNWYCYGDMQNCPATITGGNPGKCLKATAKKDSKDGYAGFSTWDWDETVWKGFPLSQTNPDKIMIKLDVNGKAGTILDVQLADADGSFVYRVIIDGTGWKSYAFKLLEMGYNEPADKSKKIDATKLKRTLQFGLQDYTGRESEVLLDNIRMVELK